VRRMRRGFSRVSEVAFVADLLADLADFFPIATL
jgi:hypothetical protein